MFCYTPVARKMPEGALEMEHYRDFSYPAPGNIAWLSLFVLWQNQVVGSQINLGKRAIKPITFIHSDPK